MPDQTNASNAQAPTRADLDKILGDLGASVPMDAQTPDGAVGLIKGAFGDLFTAEDEAAVRAFFTPKVPTREDLDKAIAALPGTETDADYVVRAMGAHFGEVFTDDDEKRVRELVKADAPRPPAKRAGGKVRTQVQRTVVDPATTSTRKTTDVDEDEVDELPTKVTLAAPYAYYDDENVLHSWGQGRVVEDPDEIALLVARGAIFEA